MPKYLFEARYSPEGAIGLAKEGGTGRRDAVKKHLDVSAAALSLAVNESGLIASRTIVLLTPEEMDRAGKTKVHFRAPGKKAPT